MAADTQAEDYMQEKNTNGSSPSTEGHQQYGLKPSLVDYGPLSHVNTASTRVPAFAGELQPGLWKPPTQRKIANPAPLGLCGFALTTFLLGCINMGTRNITEPSIVISSALAYGGLVQLCAGMWEMAAGNTFGATALSSYGGFWISLAIIFIPGGFEIQQTLIKAGGGSLGMFYDSFALYIFGWFIFTFLIMMCTLKSTLAFFLLIFWVDVAFLLLGVSYLYRDAEENPNKKLQIAGGLFALLAAFNAWYVALAGILDDSNSFFLIPVVHFPWSEKGRESRKRE